MCASKCLCQAYHPVKPDQVFSVVVVEWHVIFYHLTQRVDVLPRSPAILLCRCAIRQRPNNMNLTDDPPHKLDGTRRKHKRGKG